MSGWIAVATASVIAFALKLAGYTVPPARLEHPRVLRVTAVLPRAPFSVVVILAARRRPDCGRRGGDDTPIRGG